RREVETAAITAGWAFAAVQVGCCRARDEQAHNVRIAAVAALPECRLAAQHLNRSVHRKDFSATDTQRASAAPRAGCRLAAVGLKAPTKCRRQAAADRSFTSRAAVVARAAIGHP